MKSRRLQLAAVLAAAAALTSACSTVGPAPSTSTGGTAPTNSGPVTIDYLHRLPDGEGMTKVADIVARWNSANPNIQVKATKFDGKSSDMTTKLLADVTAGTAPCLAQLGYAEVPSMYAKGALEDVSAEAAKYAANYAPGAFSLLKINNQNVGLPQDTGPLVYYYNKKAFEDLGLTVPTTMDEFVDTAAKAAAKGKYIADFQPDEALNWLSAQTAAAGGTWYASKDDKWVVSANGEASQKVAGYWQKMLDAKSVLTENRWGDGFKAALTQQKLIGTIGAGWEAPLLSGDLASTKNNGQWAVAQLPNYGTSAPMSGPDGGSGVAVMKGCKSPAQAMEFNNWFNTQIDDLVSQGLVVAAKGTMKTPDSVKKFYGGQDVFAELATANQAMNPEFAYIPTFPAVGTDISKAAAVAATGKATVASVFEAAQQSSVKSLQDAGLPVAS